MKIYRLRGRRKVEGDVGIELEIEGSRLPHYGVQTQRPIAISDTWSIVRDGSLRNGAEYILTKPISATKVPDVLTEFQKMMEEFKTAPVYSLRTSTHIHINVNDLEYEQALNYIYLYALVENVITKMCHKSRIGNRFCLRMQDAEGVIAAAAELIKRRTVGGQAFTRYLGEDSHKYSAINMCVMAKYGSLEFRALEGTNDWKKIQLWINTLLDLRNAAQQYEEIPDIFEDLNKIGANAFLKKVLKKTFKNHWNDAAEQEILTSASITYDLVYAALKYPKKEELLGADADDPWGCLELFREEDLASIDFIHGGYRFEGVTIAHNLKVAGNLEVKHEADGAYYFLRPDSARAAFGLV